MKERLVKKLFIFGSVALFVGLIIMPAVNVESIQLVKESIALLGNNDKPSKVWVDDDFDENTPTYGTTHFDNIQDGIDAVNESGEVRVYNGTYHENIDIYKSLKMEGNGTKGQNFTIIEEGYIKITVPNVNISNFIIANSSRDGIYVNVPEYIRSKPVIIEDCKITGNDNHGIKLIENYALTIINHNEILYNEFCGIVLHKSSSNNIISNNNIKSNGIHGIELREFNNNNEIFNNNIESNGRNGIELREFNNNNEIFNNNIQFNRYGIRISDSVDSNITYNNISLNLNTGIFMKISTLGNTIINNNNIYANSHLGLNYKCSELLEPKKNFWGKETGPWIFWSKWFYIFIIFGGEGLKGEIIIFSDGKVKCKEPSPEFNRPP